MILEQISTHENSLLPKSLEQYTVLQVFLRVSDAPENIRKYMIAAERHTVSELARAYKRALQSSQGANGFFAALDRH